MKASLMFTARLVFRKPFIVFVLLLLFLMLNYVSFISLRTVISTAEGRQQASNIDSPGTYIANLDPESDFDFGRLSDDSLKKIYMDLADSHRYAFHVDGIIADVDNENELDIPVSYVNQQFDELDGFAIDRGSGLNFDYSVSKGDAIPVLIGRGLEKDYPLGSEFSLNDPALERDITVRVSGILEKDAARSNFYAYDSKTYYNYSLVVPVTEEFIRLSNIDLKINGLNDLAVVNADESSVLELENQIYSLTGARFNFFNQNENEKYYNAYYYPSMIFVSIVTLILIVLIIAGTVWSSLVNVNLMMREFTLNRLVGLSYQRLRSFF